jgi:hypothetical protein
MSVVIAAYTEARWAETVAAVSSVLAQVSTQRHRRAISSDRRLWRV